MFSYVPQVLQNAAPKFVVYAQLVFGTPDAPPREDCSTTVILPVPPSSNPMSRVVQMALRHRLTPVEIERLVSIVRDCPEEDPNEMLPEMLKCILGDRVLMTMPMLSRETIDRARKAVEEGYTPFVLQEVVD